MNLRRYYEILEVDSQTSPEALKEAYQDLLQAWNPNAFSAKPELKKKAEQKIEEIHDAYRKIMASSTAFGGSGLKGQTDSEKENRSLKPGISKKIHANHSPIHPWVRFSARLMDYLLFSMMLRWAGIFEISLLKSVPLFFFPVMVTLAWVFLEGLLLHFFAKTPGKWVFGIELIDRSLNKPGFRAAWSRSLSVWCNGLGTGFFLIAPATLAVSYVRLWRKRIAPWDRAGGFHIIYRKIEAHKLVGAGFSAAVVFLLAFHFENSHDRPVSKTLFQSPNEEMTAAERPQGPPMPAFSQKGAVDESRGQTPSASGLSRANAALLAGRYDEAIQIYQSIVKNNPNLAEARYGLGVSYAKKQRYDEAEKELEAAVNLVPEYAEAHHILGLIYLNSGDRRGALGQYRILMILNRELAEELNVYISHMENFLPRP